MRNPVVSMICSSVVGDGYGDATADLAIDPAPNVARGGTVSTDKKQRKLVAKRCLQHRRRKTGGPTQKRGFDHKM